MQLDVDDTNDKVLVEVWLPLVTDDWNGRLQATCGLRFTTGMLGAQLGVGVKSGWAAVSTDGGHDVSPWGIGDASWALKKDRTVNWNLLQNFASRSIVEQVPIGKRIVEQYYGVKPHHSYWNGCSTGGRQGYAIAQQYPHLVDAILANAPALSFGNLVTSSFWPQLRMRMTNTYLSACELEYYQTRVVEACDGLDGFQDGITEDPETCDLDPYDLVDDGRSFACEGIEVKFTKDMAQIIADVHRGPASSSRNTTFPGLAHGVPMQALVGITTSSDGVRSQNSFPISATWLKHLIFKDPAFDLSQLSDIHSYLELFGRSSYEFGDLLDTTSPDLSALEASGTKMITWHGLYDKVIPYQNTVSYREKVEGTMGGAQRVDGYFRLFFAPGVGHCGGGIGAQPHDPLGALVDWVEQGIAPETLHAGKIDSEGELVTRELCAWPAKPKYMGVGSAKRVLSWSCVGGPERLFIADEAPTPGRLQEVLSGIRSRMGGLGLGLSIE